MTKILTILLSISLMGCSLKPELSIDKKLYFTAKVWGFLKYYHPAVNTGQIDWDKELISIVEKLPTANNREELSAIFIKWIESLGAVTPAANVNYDSSNSFNKNFNLTWFENEYFTENLTNQLRYIEENRTQKHRYVTKGYVGQIEITNELIYTASQWSDQNIRLITLFRYWNVIEYFYPYKYIMDKKWDDILQYFIPKFKNIKTESDYHLLIRELTISLCDSHAFFTTDLIRSYAGNKFIPAKFRILNDKAVIYDFYDDSLARLDDLRLGDVITSVNNIPVSEIYLKNEKYINGSNAAVKKLGYSFRWIFNGSTDTITITFERDGEVKNKTIRRYDFSTFRQVDSQPVEWKKINSTVGYVNMEEGLVMAEDLSTMMKELADTRAIIFDFRNYPEFIIDELLSYLNPKPKDFAKFIQPDFTYPGRFRWTESVRCGNNNPNPYKGKVIILVNDDTQSRSEYFVMAMQTIEGSITIVIEVSDDEFNLFLGKGNQLNDLAQTLSGEIDTGYRTILCITLLDFTKSHQHHVDEIYKAIEQHEGVVILQPLEEIMVSFIYASNAIQCALSISNCLHASENVEYMIALSSGRPVDEKGNTLFEVTKKKTHYLCTAGLKNTIHLDFETQLLAGKEKISPAIPQYDAKIIHPEDFKLLFGLFELFDKNLNAPDFKSKSLYRALGWSKSQVYRKLNSLTGLAPNQFIQEVRLRQSLQRIKRGDQSIAEVAYNSGFNSPTYFTKVFRKRFGISPSSFAKNQE